MSLITNGFTIHKMKKHPIDELFASKLSEHMQEPSERAFNRFQERMDEKYAQKSRFAPWYFGAAAGLVLCSFGLFMMNNQASENQNVAVKQTVPTKTDLKELKVNQVAETLVQTVNSKKKTEFIENNSKIFIQETIKATEPQAIIQPIEEEIAQSNKQEILPSALIEDSKEVVSNGQTVPVTAPIVIPKTLDSDVILTYEVEAIPQERLRRFDEEPIGLAEAIQFEEAYFLHKHEVEKEEPSFLAKVANQFKHIKNGESLSLRELGLRPRDLIAKADSFFKNEISLESKTSIKNRNHTSGN